MKNVKISRDLSSLTKEQMEQQMMQMFAIMDELEAKVSWYEEQYRLSRAQRFGPSSEQTLPFDQMSFFNEAESESSPLIAKEPELSQVEIPRKGKKKGHKDGITGPLPVETIEYTLSAEDLSCPQCGEALHEMKKEIRKELTVVPAQVVVTEHVRYVYSCRNCERNDITTPIIQAPMPNPPIKNSLASPSMLAHIMTRKYVEAIPLYWQEQGFKRFGLNLSRQTLANWVIKGSAWLEALYEEMHRELIRKDILHYGLSPEKVSISEFDSDHILEFLTYLEKDRKNNPKTINSRLAAIHSFIKFLTFELPEYSGTLSKSLMVPFRKIERCQMEFLTESEFSALVNACEVKTALGNRDRLMLLLLYNTGIRVSELVGLKVSDVIMDSPNAGAYIRIYGKGRKIRQLPLWKTTTKYISNYVSGLKINSDESLFTNQMDSALTRSGVRYRLNCLQERASETSPSLAKKKITPHTFRHTAALRMLQSGVDISTIAIWMGHESILTTHKYMEADMELKRQTLEKMSEPGRNYYHFVPKSSTLKFLDSL